MKNILLCIFLAICIFIGIYATQPGVSYSGGIETYFKSVVTVSTTGVTLCGSRTNRRWMKVKNTGESYNAYIATYPISSVTLDRKGAMKLERNGGWWEEDFYPTATAWYACTSTATSTSASTTIEIEEKE